MKKLITIMAMVASFGASADVSVQYLSNCLLIGSFVEEMVLRKDAGLDKESLLNQEGIKGNDDITKLILEAYQSNETPEYAKLKSVTECINSMD